MNEQREEKTPRCCFHPKQQLVGVCPVCLNERLLVLAAKQGNNQQRHQPRKTKHQSVIVRRYGGGESAHLQGKRSAVRFVRVCWGSHDESVDQIQGTSLEDRFISIKFEKNGVASWEEKRVSKPEGTS
ncbi:hypothetical protein Droror1_Dr00005102 [Drosera rotundifolia]